MQTGAALISVLLTALTASGMTAGNAEDPGYLVALVGDGSYHVTSKEARHATLSVAGLHIDRPIVFELGREGRHLRRAYPSISRGRILIDAAPLAEYAIYPEDVLVDSVLSDVCRVPPEGMSRDRKLQALASTAADNSETDRHSRRRAIEALQALLGLEFRAAMEYPSLEGGDYRVYAGSGFRVTCGASNGRTQGLTGIRFGLIAPDEWDVRAGGSSAGSLGRGETASTSFVVRAPARSLLRAPVSPMIASFTFGLAGREFTVHYPFEVRLSDPFVPKLTITASSADRIAARIELTTAYPGREMRGISVYPWLATDLTIGPERQTVGMSAGKGSFRTDYIPRRSGASYQAVTVVMKLDEHLVRLRSVMEASIDLGATTRGAAIWLNDYADAHVMLVTKPERRYRSSTAHADGLRYMYFGVSPNMPATGTTYVTVMYLDAGNGSFTLQYDSTDSAYRECADAVRLDDSRTWKTHTFALDDARLSDRQNGKSDFRLVVRDGELSVARVVVSKFAR